MKTNDKNKYKDFGDRLSLIMYKQNISNIQLANAMFVSPSTISGYRTGRRSPTVADLAAIVQILNVSADTSSEPVKLQPDPIPPKKRVEHALFPERCSTLFYKSCSASKITVERSGTRTRV